MIVHATVLVGVAAALLTAAWWLDWLTPRGTGMAALVGAAVYAGTGVGGLVLLLLFFATSSALTVRNPARVADGDRRKPRRSAAPLSDRDAEGRGGRQVLANGGVAAVAGLLGLADWLPLAHYAVAGSLAAATADTWATEAGTARAGKTRLITSWKPVPPGSSGGISAAGTAAGAAGALLIAGAAAFLPSAHAPIGLGMAPVWAGGLAGMLVDSLLGATSETRVEHIGNDAVNLAGTLTGAIAAWSIATLLSVG